MKRARALLVALTLAVSACSSGGGPSWTYAPAAAAPSGAAASPAASASGAPACPATSASPAASGSGSGGWGTTISETAQNIAFQQTSLSAPAGSAFQITFTNQDSGVPHNMEIKDSSGASKFKGELVTGPNSATYQVPALPAGSYTFICDVHPNITGTLTVK